MMQPTPEQIDDIKLANLRTLLLETLSKHYSDLVKFIQQLPNLNPTIKSHIFLNLDQGIFWVREGILEMKLTFQKQELNKPDTSNQEIKQEEIQQLLPPQNDSEIQAIEPPTAA